METAPKRRVLITGASRGIGRALAIRLAQDGFEVSINYKSNHAKAQEVLEEIRSTNGKAELLAFDVADRAQTLAAIESDVKAHGPYFGLILNAGIAQDAPFPVMKAEAWDSVIKTNLDGFYNVIQPNLMPMIEARSGRILTISSVAGLVGHRGQVNYSAAKAGVIAATKSLAQELAKRTITVNCIAPGLIETDMVAHLPQEDLLKSIPMRRLGKPEEVASLASFLFSPEAAYITGQVISVNGGLL